MAKKLYTINTVNNFMDIIYTPHVKKYADEVGDLTVFNIMDDSLLRSTLDDGCVSPKTASRMLNYAKAAEESGADGIIVTCTSVNMATKWIKPFLNIPIINIEEPVAEMAVAAGKKIGIIATLPTSPAAIERVIREKAAEQGKEIEIVIRVADGAFDVLCAGDRPKHDAMIREHLYSLADEVDCIACAQISMSLLEHDELKVPIFKIGRSGMERIHELMNK
ncbi:MAG: Asp/Glu racemase [Candidatus Epulonipiscioides saccharophilum]|nr:MAG: Asp/Glu racemase [Epulopiscium sp. AS2M-Bin001]